MSTEQSNAAFEKWWTAPEQRELRSSCAKGWGERIWQASRAALVVDLTDRAPFLLIPRAPSPTNYIEAGILWVTKQIVKAGITVKNAPNRTIAATTSTKACKRVNWKENGSKFD